MAKIKDYLLDRRILTLIVIAVALLALDLHYGLHLGIEFIGGTQIPVTLQHGLNQSEFSGLLSTLDQRVSTFGPLIVTSAPLRLNATPDGRLTGFFATRDMLAP